MNIVSGQIGGIWEHLKHPLDLNRDDLKINLKDQKGKLLMQSIFCGAAATLIASFIRTQPLTPTAKIGFIFLAVGVTETTFLLLTLVLKIEKVYAKMSEASAKMSEVSAKMSELINDNQVLSKKIQELSSDLKESQEAIKEMIENQIISETDKKEEEKPKDLLKLKDDVVEVKDKEPAPEVKDKEPIPIEESPENEEQMITRIKDYYLEWKKGKNLIFLTIDSEASEPASCKVILRTLKNKIFENKVVLNVTKNSSEINQYMRKHLKWSEVTLKIGDELVEGYARFKDCFN